jgi:hypothetical protein
MYISISLCLNRVKITVLLPLVWKLFQCGGFIVRTLYSNLRISNRIQPVMIYCDSASHIGISKISNRILNSRKE